MHKFRSCSCRRSGAANVKLIRFTFAPEHFLLLTECIGNFLSSPSSSLMRRKWHVSYISVQRAGHGVFSKPWCVLHLLSVLTVLAAKWSRPYYKWMSVIRDRSLIWTGNKAVYFCGHLIVMTMSLPSQRNRRSRAIQSLIFPRRYIPSVMSKLTRFYFQLRVSGTAANCWLTLSLNIYYPRFIFIFLFSELYALICPASYSVPHAVRHTSGSCYYRLSNLAHAVRLLTFTGRCALSGLH